MNCRSNSSPTVYHGLWNQGATCYLNSVLQVLFMTKEFREALRETAVNPGSDFIDHQLRSLFEELSSNTARTCKITSKLGIKGTSVNEQRDAAEYFEKILSKTSPEASQIFQGNLTHKNICVCGTETNTDGPFWSLPLPLVDSDNKDYRVVDGIKNIFKPVDATGDNQMYCDHCDDKADATVKCVINHHPDVLMLLLKRFKFDFRYMENVKIHCRVDVPYKIQIPENQMYELYAFVEHFGSLGGGHYTATIKDDESWYNFNDDTVTPLNCNPFQEKSKSAYLLFYRKKTVPSAETPEDFQLNNSKNCQDAEKIYNDRNNGTQKQRKKKQSRKDEFSEGGDYPNNHSVGKVPQKRPADYEDGEHGITDKSMRHENPQHNVGQNDKVEHEKGNQKHRCPGENRVGKDVEGEEKIRTEVDETDKSESEITNLRKVNRDKGNYQEIRRGGEIQQSKSDDQCQKKISAKERYPENCVKRNSDEKMDSTILRQPSAGSRGLTENQTVDNYVLARPCDQYKGNRVTQAERRSGESSAEKTVRGGISHTETVRQITHSGSKTKMTPRTDDEAYTKIERDPKAEDQSTFPRTSFHSSVKDSPASKAQHNRTTDYYPGSVEKDNGEKSSAGSKPEQMSYDKQVQHEQTEGERRKHGQVENEPNTFERFLSSVFCIPCKRREDKRR